MAVNKKLIERYKLMYQQIKFITPKVYAAIAIAMHRRGYSFEEIENIIDESQAIWTECVQGDVNMLEMCKNETGIDIERGD